MNGAGSARSWLTAAVWGLRQCQQRVQMDIRSGAGMEVGRWHQEFGTGGKHLSEGGWHWRRGRGKSRMRNSCLHPPPPTPGISSSSIRVMRICCRVNQLAQKAGEGNNGFLDGPSLSLLYMERSCPSSTGVRGREGCSSYSTEGEIKAQRGL